jgi:ribose transport system permease protein
VSTTQAKGSESADQTKIQLATQLIQRIGAVWLAVILLYLIAGIVSPAMLSARQILNVLQVAAFLGTVAVGQTIVLLVGGIDLSVASMVTLTNIVATSLMNGAPENVPLALLTCVVLAVFVGLINGTLVAVLRITPLIATLGMNLILFGAALVYTGGAPRGSAAPNFTPFGQDYFLGIPVSALVWLALALLVAFITRKTVYGRQLYAVGANARAARLMGVKVERITISAYVLSSLMACAGGLLITAYIGLPSLGIGEQFLLTSVAAAVVGGTSLTGGRGSVIGTIGGALFITELNSVTNVLRVSNGVQFILQGVIIALSVLAYRGIGRKK